VGECSFTKESRLLEAGAYKRVFDGAETKVSHKHFLLLGCSNSLNHNRLGLVIAKKHIRLAVQRNRIKRITREFFRTCPAGKEGLDVIFLARKGADQLDNAVLSSILRQQWLKLAHQ
jgi:ribonuclease P protein component